MMVMAMVMVLLGTAEKYAWTTEAPCMQPRVQGGTRQRPMRGMRVGVSHQQDATRLRPECRVSAQSGMARKVRMPGR